MKPISLYLHIPFCARKCAYCDFASWPGREALWPRYFAALREELLGWADRLADRTVTTVFLGGGTPSLPPAGEIAALLAAVREAYTVAPDAEITLEANPGTLTPEKLARYRGAGVNRLSLGVQSFDDGLLRALGRIHTADEARAAVRLAREAGFENLNLDLMYALPGQTPSQWRETLSEAIALGVPHISAYSLIVEEGTPMAVRVAEGSAILPDEDAVLDMQRGAIDLLASTGLQRYEISNYACPGRECRHNYVYWTRGEYLGLGCAAHSLVDETRFENPAPLEAYLNGACAENRREIPAAERARELVMLATRTTKGLSLDAYQREFGERFEQAHATALQPLIAGGLAEIRDGWFRLTRRGLEVQNAIVLALWEDMDA